MRRFKLFFLRGSPWRASQLDRLLDLPDQTSPVVKGTRGLLADITALPEIAAEDVTQTAAALRRHVFTAHWFDYGDVKPDVIIDVLRTRLELALPVVASDERGGSRWQVMDDVFLRRVDKFDLDVRERFLQNKPVRFSLAVYIGADDFALRALAQTLVKEARLGEVIRRLDPARLAADQSDLLPYADKPGVFYMSFEPHESRGGVRDSAELDDLLAGNATFRRAPLSATYREVEVGNQARMFTSHDRRVSIGFWEQPDAAWLHVVVSLHEPRRPASEPGALSETGEHAGAA